MQSVWPSIFLQIYGFAIVYGLQSRDHAGVFSHNLETAHLVVPRKVDQYGDIVDNYLTHHHDGNASNFENRVHYRMELGNDTLHLELEPSTLFVGPSMIIERHKRDVRTRKKSHKNRNCHYQGQVRGHDDSKVAISACGNGLAGFMRTKSGEYWIEPSKHHPHTNKQIGQPHVVFQRSAVKVNNKLHNANKKKKKLKRRRKRHPSNCGTKEPKRITETKIEWQPQGKVIVQGGRKTRLHPNEYNIVEQPAKRQRKRNRRSISQPNHVEALVVADPSMLMFHQDGDVETYLLTIMNMVSSLYKDPNIGNLIHVVIVKIVLLEEEDDSSNLNITHVAGSTLESFCNWQRDLNPGIDDPYHHDVAILITRTNICSVAGCSTLGVANVGGMCKPDRSCSVNEDNGITLAHTITHELGHNFGMLHDTVKTGCDNRIGPILHIMTPSFEADTVQVSWSNCSRKYITNFLDQGKGRCLEDPPDAEDYSYPELPPGAMYNADLQCRLQFNSTDETSVCSRPNEICSQLWCMVDGACTTLLRPAAAGTHCEKHKWCQNQECVPIEDLPDRVDGGWGAWSGWSDCSKNCGAGIAKQLRECNHPSPAYGGSFCVGERSRYKICNVEECPKTEPSFRAVQCSKYNNKTFKGQNYTWLPHFDSQSPCELLCTDSDDTMIVPFGDAAADGTPCNIGTNDMCIDGICKKVGCDWTVDSNTTEDQCGVCGGNGNTCTTIIGEFTEKLNITDGLYEIVVIPMGSRNILVEEMGPSKNYIGVGKGNSDEFYLNGHGMIFMSGEYEIAGTLGLYERQNDDLEKLKIPGPIKHNISVNIVLRGKHKNFGVKYEYTLPTNLSTNPVVTWQLSDFTPCSATCGGGTKYKFPVCYQIGEGVVSDDDCVASAENEKPEKVIKICNEDPCPAFWWIGPWQLCQATCQKLGEPMPVRKRSIMCVDQNEMALGDDRCTESRPIDAEVCPGKLPFCSLDGNDYDINALDKNVPEDGNDENNAI